MQNIKLIELLQSLSPQELRWFKEFVESKFFNKHEGVKELMEIITPPLTPPQKGGELRQHSKTVSSQISSPLGRSGGGRQAISF